MSRFLIDAAYGSAALFTSPVWLWRMHRTGKLKTDWRARFGRVDPPLPPPSRPRILLHAVSVGEVNAIRLLVAELAASPEKPEVVVAATTDTGFARATALFAPAHRVVRYPFDASGAVRRFLDAVRPSLVALIELEVWPNFTAECARRGIGLAVVNGRLSERSFGRYMKVRPLVRPSFARLDAVSAQTDAYATRFAALGVEASRVAIGGTMKWDTAEISDAVPGADDLARDFGLDRSKPLVVAASTAPGEETLIDSALPEGTQLLVAPRKPEWFAGVAAALPGAVRRTATNGAPSAGSPTGRYVLDTIGELRRAMALADVVVVGRSFGVLHGSDMMEPVALGKATVIGPRYGDFRDMMDALKAGGGIVETDAAGLKATLARLLASPAERASLATGGRNVIRSRQGATRRNAEMLLATLARKAASRA